MAFVFFAAAAVLWSLLVIRWSMSLRKGRGAAAVLLLSFIVIGAGFVSVVSDLRNLWLRRKSEPSDLAVRVIRRGEWWQLDYQRGGISFTTANELRLPAGAVVRMTWSDLPMPWVEGAQCLRE